jgi:hypothetical protein
LEFLPLPCLGLSEALPACDVWKGSWKFEIDRHGPWLGYYDTRAKTVFLIGCGTHFEMLAVYPAPPKQDVRQIASITIANGKTQMDFTGFIDAGSEHTADTTIFDQADLGYPELDKINGARWKIASWIFWAPGSRWQSRPRAKATCCRRSTCRGGGRASRKSADAPPQSDRAPARSFAAPPVSLMSALPPNAEMVRRSCDVRFVPILLQKSVEGRRRG